MSPEFEKDLKGMKSLIMYLPEVYEKDVMKKLKFAYTEYDEPENVVCELKYRLVSKEGKTVALVSMEDKVYVLSRICSDIFDFNSGLIHTL